MRRRCIFVGSMLRSASIVVVAMVVTAATQRSSGVAAAFVVNLNPPSFQARHLQSTTTATRPISSLAWEDALSQQQQQQQQQPWLQTTTRRRRLIMSSSQQQQQQNTNTNNNRKEPNLDSNDPLAVLGLSAASMLDPKEIKRAYKRLALQYHPDVATDRNATPQEKKLASDRFAKINWAYQVLSGKEKASSSSTTGSSSRSSSEAWTPPHRRRGGTSSSSSSSSNRGFDTEDWRDYIPNYGGRSTRDDDDDEYGTAGDSLGAIFSDFVKEVAGGASRTGSGGVGLFRDFVEFLENNVEAYSPQGSTGSAADDADLRLLLRTGSLQDVGDEMDETQLVVQQLSSKLQSIQDDLITLRADLKVTTKFSEKIPLEEAVAECEARQKVVQGYLKQAQKRLLALQTRYKELIVQGNNDSFSSRQRSSSSYTSPGSSSSSSSSYSSSSSSSSYSEPRSRASSSNTREGGDNSNTNKDASWQTDSFGSFGRRGSSRRGRSTRQTTSSSSSSSSTREERNNPSEPQQQQTQRTTATSSSYGSRTTTTTTTGTSSSNSGPAYEPPHRRTSSTRVDEDKRRLRELKVDEEFEKLKRDLGL